MSGANLRRMIPSNYNLEVSLGNIPGVAGIQVLGLNPAVSSVYNDCWCPGGTLVYPTAAETWEVVSTSLNDTAAGTGAREVEIISMGSDYVEQYPVRVTLSGTTPVTIPGTHFRHIYTRVTDWGSAGWNEGHIIVRVAGGGNVRTCMYYDSVDSIGLNNTQDSHFTVPAGKTFFPAAFFINCTKDHDITARFQRRLFGEAGFLTPGNFGVYQNSFIFNFATYLGKDFLPEKTDFKWIVKSNNTSVAVTTGIEGFLVDN